MSSTSYIPTTEDSLVNKADFPGSILHGDAWRYFVRMHNVHGSAVQGEHREKTLDRWNWFLAGWKSKCEQHNDLRRK